MKVFLDTNVIIDFYSQREEHFQRAAIIMDLAVRGQIELIVSGTTFVNAFFLLKDFYDRSELYEAMSKLASKCHISPINSEMIVNGLTMRSPDFEDAVQLLSAKSAQADVFITRDKHFKHFEGNIMSPKLFLEFYFTNKI